MTASRGDPVRGSRWSRPGIGVLLAASVPLLVVLALPEMWVLPAVGDRLARAAVRVLQALTVLALGLLGTGVYLARRGAPTRGTAPAGGDAVPATPAGPATPDEPASQTFLGALARVESHAQEMDALARRLEAAYQDLEITTARLKQLSFRDEVTGLYNRRFFSLRLAEELSRFRRFSRPVSVVMLDLDGFKTVNDRLGHPTGDDALRDIAGVLLRHSRGINVISRFGGDEFAMLLVETPREGAWRYADRIRQVIAGHPVAHGLRLTASFGVSSLPEDPALSPEDLIRSADEALYAAKRGGRNRVVVHDPESIESPAEPLA
jgi:diguanylate cyclase (GGDEF)-like protein